MDMKRERFQVNVYPACVCVRSGELTCAVPLVSIEVKAAVAPAAETSDGVAALPVSAEVVDHLTLVYICSEKERSHSG